MRFIGLVTVCAALWAGSAGVASANRVSAHLNQGRKVQHHRRGEMVVAVPELDPNAAGLALMLLGGGVLLVVDRRRVRVG